MLERAVVGRWPILLLRLVLGGIFIGASIGKLQDQAGFINAVTGYGILPQSLANAYGLALPWAELFIGCCLVLGVFTTLAAALGFSAAVSFGVANIYALAGPGGDSCGCFGEMLPMSYPVALAVDIFMLGAALLLILHRDKAAFLSLGKRISCIGLACRADFCRMFDMGTKFALLAVLVIGVGLPLARSEESPIFQRMDESLRRSIPVVLVFYLDECSLCKEQKPVIAQLKQDLGAKVTFLDVNYASESDVVLTFNVRRIPTVIVINCKQHDEYIVYEEYRGFTDYEVLRGCLDGIPQLRGGPAVPGPAPALLCGAKACVQA
ncbi:MAG: DoxX family membrane protein [Dehalococcoidia bacterium]|nr:DoxX family membrane protein [Dehalococcoidia bacterium]